MAKTKTVRVMLVARRTDISLPAETLRELRLTPMILRVLKLSAHDVLSGNLPNQARTTCVLRHLPTIEKTLLRNEALIVELSKENERLSKVLANSLSRKSRVDLPSAKLGDSDLHQNG